MTKVTAPDHQIRAAQTAQLRAIAHLASLLQHLETSSQSVHPDQYRTVVEHLTAQLQTAVVSDELGTILKAYPASGELYENLRYELAGLCLHDLDRAIASEQLTQRTLNALRQR